ncbi:MAG: hypothetical protein FJX80_14680 [Bacteroidetes bacterium]|nr:hypothetical protein [Bacteroidota bacterium]
MRTRGTLVFIFLVGLAFSNFAQKKEINPQKLIQLSGIAVSDGSLDPVPFITVYDRTMGRGVLADSYGFFSLVTYPGDSVIFNAFGFKPSTYVVPDTLTENRYSIIHLMEIDTINLPEVTLYPWPTKEQFDAYIVNMEPYDDAIRRAQRELSGESLAIVAAKLDADGSLAYGNAYNERMSKLYTNGQLPVNNLFNPYSWSKLIQDWKQGKLKKK